MPDLEQDEALPNSGEEVEDWIEEEEGEEESEPILTTDETVEEKYAKSQLRVVRESKDFTLDYLRYALNDKGFIIDVSPEYQRRPRWSPKKRSQLIESFLINVPVPPIFLYEKNFNEYEVIDGRQRLESIRDFLGGAFQLTSLKYWKEFNYKKFDQLPTILQKGLLRRSLGATVLLAETQIGGDGFDVRTVLFERLNTGGEKLNPQELRNALYPSEFNRILLRQARNPIFCRAWGIPLSTGDELPENVNLEKNIIYKTMADCELVLRFFAIKEAILLDAKGSLRRILDRCMIAHKMDTPDIANAASEEFKLCLEALSAIYGSALFKLPETGRASRPLYDALMVGFALGRRDGKVLRSNHKIIEDINISLANKADYDVWVGKGNTFEHIKSRVKLAIKMLYEP